jgi:hypothetical protein
MLQILQHAISSLLRIDQRRRAFPASYAFIGWESTDRRRPLGKRRGLKRARECGLWVSGLWQIVRLSAAIDAGYSDRSVRPGRLKARSSTERPIAGSVAPALGYMATRHRNFQHSGTA